MKFYPACIHCNIKHKHEEISVIALIYTAIDPTSRLLATHILHLVIFVPNAMARYKHIVRSRMTQNCKLKLTDPSWGHIYCILYNGVFVLALLFCTCHNKEARLSRQTKIAKQLA